MPNISEDAYNDEMESVRRSARLELAEQLELVVNDDMTDKEKLDAINEIVDEVIKNKGE